jgi:ABC-type spermidine/putrescine transport system permease subunit I
MYRQMLGTFDWPAASAIATVMIAITGTIIFSLSRIARYKYKGVFT